MSDRPREVSDEEKQASKMLVECGMENLAFSSLMGAVSYRVHKHVIGILGQDNPFFMSMKRNKSIIAGVAGLFIFTQSFRSYAKIVCRPRLEKSFPGITEQMMSNHRGDFQFPLTENMKAKQQDLIEQKRSGYGPLLDPKQDWSDDTLGKPQPVERYTYVSKEDLPQNDVDSSETKGARPPQHDRYTYVSDQDKAVISGQSAEGSMNGKPVRRNKYGDIIYDSDY